MRLPPAERRRSPRLRLQVPLFLRGIDDSGAEFIDLTKTVDISATGAFLACRRGLRTNQLLRLTIPVASESFSGLIPAETPPIQARVRRVCEAGDSQLVGVEFLKALD
jgi:PilZ domain